MASPLELASYVQGQFNQGRERRDTNRLASLASQAYGAAPDQQRELVGQAISTNPEAGFALGQNLGSDRNSRVQQLSQMARMLVSYKESGNEAGVQGLYPRIAQEAQAVGLGQGIPEQWDDAYLPGMQQLAQIGGAAGGNTVQSRFVADDGRVMMVMRDGTVTDSGQKADRQMWFRDHPGMDPELVGKDGSVLPVGQPQTQPMQTPQQAPQQQFAPPRQGQHPNVEQVLAQANAASRAGVPQDQIEAWVHQQLNQAPQGGAQSQPMQQPIVQQQPASAPVGGALAPRMDYAGGGLARPSEAQTAAQVEMARQQAQLAALPQELAIRTQGAIDTKVAEQGVERMPAAVRNAVTDLEQKAATAEGIMDRMQRHRSKILSGELDFGPISNQAARARNMAGMSTEQSRNFQLFMSDMEKMRNDSLRLNNGVQTEGDAQRAWNELFANLNDREYVLAGLERIDEINQRAAEIYKSQATEIRSEYPGSQQQSEGGSARLRFNPATGRIE